MTALATLPRATVTLRLAELADCEAVWRWSFAPDVGARSRRGQAIAFVEHARWFAARLADRREPIWIIEDNHRPVGVVRFERAASGLARISIALAASARGRGVGKIALAAACLAWGEPVFAELVADNLASRGCFEACGFQSVVACDGLLTYHWDPEP